MASDREPSDNGHVGRFQEDDESEWEYEYHDTEVETFYVTLDLSSVSNNRHKRTQKLSSLDSNPLPDQDPEGPNHPINVPRSPQEPVDILAEEERLQILDFHTTKPLISYKNQLYACTWTKTIGTDILLDSASTASPPLLATTHHKLLARPARLVPRSEPKQSIPSPSHPEPEIHVSPPVSISNEKPARIPLDTHVSLARQRQAAFLERFMKAKANRGEKDQVTVYAQKRMTGTGWRSQQKAAALEATAKGGEGGEDGAAAVAYNVERTNNDTANQDIEASRTRARVRRQRGQIRAKKYRGTLFADSRSTASAEVVVQTTPQTWKQLDQKNHTESGDGGGTPDFEPEVEVDETIDPRIAGRNDGPGEAPEPADVIMEDFPS